MAEEGSQRIEDLVDGLTKEEIAILRKALIRAEWHLIQAVATRLKVSILIISGVLTAFGIASLSTVRDASVETLVTRLASDAELRNQVVAGASEKLEGVEGVLQKSEALGKRLETEEIRAMRMVSTDLERVAAMMHQLQEDLATNGRIANAAR